MTRRKPQHPEDEPRDEIAEVLAEEEGLAKRKAAIFRKLAASLRLSNAARARRLAALGLTVPKRDPARRLTRSQTTCGKNRVAAFNLATGKPAKLRSYCNSWGCAKKCPAYKSEHILDRAREYVRDFVGNSPNANNLGIGEKPDKLWVWMVPASQIELAQLCEVVNRRIARLGQKYGIVVEWVRVPCDGMTVIVATHDLSQAPQSGGRAGRPRYRLGSGTWVASGDAFDYLGEVFLSRSIRTGKAVKWSDNWRPEPQPTRFTEPVRGAPARIDVAWKYVYDDGYRYIKGDPWCADPVSVWQDALAQADKFLANQVCPECATPLQYLSDVWCRNGVFICRTCDLADDLGPFLHLGRTQREIECFLRDRRITFRRNGPRLRAALKDAGAHQLACGVWVIESEPDQAEVSR